MENKTYKYGNAAYRLRPLTLGVLSSAAPMLAGFAKLREKYVQDIDMTAVNEQRNRIDELELSIRQLERISGEMREAPDERILGLRAKLLGAKEQFDNDKKVQCSLTLYTECLGFALLEAIGDKNMISPFLKKVLVSSAATEEEIEFDMDGEGAFDLVKDVVHDFFCSIAGPRKISAG